MTGELDILDIGSFGGSELFLARLMAEKSDIRSPRELAVDP